MNLRTLMVAATLAFTLTAAAGEAMMMEPPAATPDTGGAKAKPKVYDEKADAKVQIASAVAKAKKDNKRVLVQWGGNWCGWCIRLHALYKSDAKIARELMYEYEVVMVDAGQPNGKNEDLAKVYGADLSKGYPYLTVLDGNGKAIANQETDGLEVKDGSGKSTGLEAGHSPAAVLKFLTDHKATYAKADDVLKAGVAEAKTNGKRVFVHFEAPWCGWCHRLEDWMAMPEVAALVGKEFVDVKIDTDRMVGGQAMLDAMNKGKSGGIPWFVFLDEAGQPIIDSVGPKGNAGFPSAPAEVEHFGVMLKKAAKVLTADDIAKLTAMLGKKDGK